MLSYIKGEIIEILEDRFILENQNMGYNILAASSLLSELPGAGKIVKVYTYLYVREDAINLYGFLTRDDLRVFKLLLQVNGIGPKAALGILSTITPDDLRIAVLTEDIKSISKAPGIGTKTAQKLVIELKDKLKLEDISTVKESTAGDAWAPEQIKSEAVQALTALGYTDTQAYKAVKLADTGEFTDTEALLKAALKKINTLI